MAEPPESWKPFLGRKVSIRFRLHDDAGHRFSEAIGVVMKVADSERGERVTLVTKRGETVEVSSDDVLAAKAFQG